ncbi:hypothetical protein BIV25_21505 [Streptomyces sp. MUSC 14]|nr:hypothetical protein BIV25_21505 [Streptomyces sp. MUSC 14]
MRKKESLTGLRHRVSRTEAVTSRLNSSGLWWWYQSMWPKRSAAWTVMLCSRSAPTMSVRAAWLRAVKPGCWWGRKRGMSRWASTRRPVCCHVQRRASWSARRARFLTVLLMSSMPGRRARRSLKAGGWPKRIRKAASRVWVVMSW